MGVGRFDRRNRGIIGIISVDCVSLHRSALTQVFWLSQDLGPVGEAAFLLVVAVDVQVCCRRIDRGWVGEVFHWGVHFVWVREKSLGWASLEHSEE